MDDFMLAVQLQEQFDREYQTSLLPSEDDGPGHSSKKRRLEETSGFTDVVPFRKVQPERPMSIVDASWETLDPNPDIRSMFLEFNDMFFWGKLCGVEVKWSPRMTLCAGVCSYEGRGGLCSIRLSEPLLKLRPRKDLVETLLHEMIHALLFVTQNNRDRDGHGPEFCKHMHRINKASGTKITVYHSFHDEVDVYRQHWWRCDGPCQNRKPYFGYVKRAMNRAPSSLDPWWEDHRRSCGGTYTKVKEPEGYGKKGKKDGKKDGKTSGKTSGKTAAKKAPVDGKPSSTPTVSGSQDIRNVIPFSGRGFLLGGKSQTSTQSSTQSSTPLTPASPVKTSNIVSSPKKPFTSPSPPTTAPTFPGRSGLDHSGVPRPWKQKPPVKKSVSNTRVFTNVNGSPMKIHTPPGHRDSSKARQTSIQDLFRSPSPRKTASQSSASDTATRRDAQTDQSSTQSSPSPKSSFQPKSSSAVPSAATGGAVAPTQSRKRLWNDQSSSASIFELFQKTLEKTKSPQAPKATPRISSTSSSSSSSASASSSSSASASSSSLHSSAGQSSAAPPSSPSSSSSSSSVLMVSCPVCLVKVQESKINEHLDSCLS